MLKEKLMKNYTIVTESIYNENKNMFLNNENLLIIKVLNLRIPLEKNKVGILKPTIRFYNTLKEANVPVYLCDAEELLNRVLEKDKIGIVPDYTITKYQESNFEDEKIIDFLHLDDEKEEEMIKLAEWKKLEKVYLK